MIGEDVVRMLAYGDVGQWRRPDLQGFGALLGWELDAASRFTVDGAEIGGVSLSEEGLARFGFGEISGLRIAPSVPADELADAYRETLTTATAVLGPPTVVGGPGARATWRLPDRNVTFDARLHDGAGLLGLGIEPREPAEARDYFNWEWDAEYEPPYRWALQPIPDDELFFTAWPPASDWDAFAVMVRAVFGALAVDVPLLGPVTQTVIWNIAPEDDDTRYVQGWFSADECHLELPGTDTALTARNGMPGLTLESGVASLGERVADLALRAVRSWRLSGPRELNYRAWSNREGSRVIVFGIGITSVTGVG